MSDLMILSGFGFFFSLLLLRSMISVSRCLFQIRGYNSYLGNNVTFLGFFLGNYCLSIFFFWRDFLFSLC
jgi:hypothetical protein